jgi:hypothetical protein
MTTEKSTIVSRRQAVLAAAMAVLPAATTAVLASEPGPHPDPVHGLIRDHGDAMGQFLELAQRLSWAERAGLEALDLFDDLVIRHNQALDQLEAAEIAVLTARPTTLPGLVAVLDWHHERTSQNQCRLSDGETELEKADRSVWENLAAAARVLAVQT